MTADVRCLQEDNGPCIKFGKPGIKLDLNGFTMTGPANNPPRANCVTAANFPAQEADGTSADRVENSVVEKLVSYQSCFSGIFLGFVNNTLVEGVVAARTSANSEARPCGGVCVTNSNNNRVRRSEFAGNGSIAPGAGTPPIPPQAAIPNDFGVGLVGSSSGNIIEENGMSGNINGLALFPIGTSTPRGNLIRKNVIVGNPPMEVSAANPAITPVGADIRDFSAPGSNTFEENLCITYTGPANPPPCPNLPRFAGHRTTMVVTGAGAVVGAITRDWPGYPAQRGEHAAAELGLPGPIPGTAAGSSRARFPSGPGRAVEGRLKVENPA